MSKIETGRKTFIQLTDVPQSYVGLGNRVVTVKGTEDGLETIPQSTVTPTTFIALTDTPASYAGASSKFVKVNSTANGLEFVYFPIRTSLISTTLTVNDFTVMMNATGGNVVATLPDATTVTGIVYNIKKKDTTANIVTISATGAQTIDNIGSLTLTVPYQSITIQSDGANWWII
jgi:hypothetical protein